MKHKIINWIKTHKWQIGGGALALAGMCAAYYAGKKAGINMNVLDAIDSDIKDNIKKGIPLNEAVMDFKIDVDGSEIHVETWEEPHEICSIVTGVTSNGACESLQTVIDTMKELNPHYDYTNGNLIVEFMKTA